MGTGAAFLKAWAAHVAWHYASNGALLKLRSSDGFRLYDKAQAEDRGHR